MAAAAAQTRPDTSAPTSAGGRALVAVIAIAVVQLLLVLVFAWSSSRAAPHDVPIAVAGPPTATQALAQGLAQARPGAFDVQVVADDAAARSAVTGRTADAAVVVGPTGATVYTASAGSAALAQMLGQALPAAVRTGRPAATVTVTDLVSPPVDDPHAAGLGAGLIPLTITSIAAGAVAGLLVRRRMLRLGVLAVYAILAGALSTLALQTLLGALAGPWVADAAVLSLACLAIAAATAGLVSLLGAGGAVLGVLVLFFFGFPFSGAASSWRMLPTPWGWLAQGLPVGAVNQALRSVAFFDGSGSGGALLVLGVWAAVGVLGCLVVRRPRGGPAVADG